MKVNKASDTITFATRDDGRKCMIAKVRNGFEVFVDGAATGYKFRSLKKALEYCEFGF